MFVELRNLRGPCPRARPSPYESDSSVQFTILAVVNKEELEEEEGRGREERDVERVKSNRRW